jgi:NAD(P)-dependent dehydrogenase (short-subunit alcohol dehydrogenase family)
MRPPLTRPDSGVEGLRVLVTGGSSGIGAATVARLRSIGAFVVSVDVAAPQHVAGAGAGDNAGDGAGERVHEVRADLRSAEEVDAAVAAAVAALGGLDVVVANAGVGAVGTVLDNSDEEWVSVLDINVLGLVRLMRAALPHLRDSPHPSVVVTTSVVADRGFPNRALYSASKGALQSLALAMAADLLQDGIRVNVVSPGTTDTPWVRRLLDASDDPEQQHNALVARQPLGRLVRPAEVAHAIAYLLSTEAAATTGVVLHVDGGLTGLHARRDPAAAEAGAR